MAKANLTGVQALSLYDITTVTSTVAGTAVDISAYEGVVAVVINVESVSGTNPTLDIHLQTNTASSGGTWVDIEGAAFPQAGTGSTTEVISVDTTNTSKFIRMFGQIGGTATPTLRACVTLLGTPKYDT